MRAGGGLAMARQRNVIRLGAPALIVAGLAIAALWRIGAPVQHIATVGTSGTIAGPAGPLTQVAEIVLDTAPGRTASLERVPVREITSPRTFWIGPADEPPAFVVLDPD